MADVFKLIPLEKRNKPIDLVEMARFLKLGKGDLFCLPVEDAAIHAYGITYEELTPYMEPKYFSTNWIDITLNILSDRKQKAQEI